MQVRYLIIILFCCSFSIISAQNHEQELDALLIHKQFNKAQSLCKKITPLTEIMFIKCGRAYEFDDNEIKAAKLYDLGLKEYPNSFELRYEKALLFLNNNKDYEASLTLLPLLEDHKENASVHNAIGRAEYNQNRTAALMALLVTEFLDSDTKYSQQNIISIKELFKRKSFKKKSSAKGTMSLHGSNRSTKTSNYNSFNHTDFVLTTQSVMGDFDITNEIELLTKQFNILGASLKETREAKQGEYWKYYAPLFIKIQEYNLSETAAYYLLRNKNVSYKNWLNKNKDKTNLLKKLIL